MKTKWIFLFCLSGLLGCGGSKDSTNSQDMMQISGQLTYTQDYCKGAPPSEELLAQLKTPRPLEGYVLTLRAGRQNSMSSSSQYESTTDSLGRYSLEVPVGEYVLLLPEQKDEQLFYESQENNYRILDEAKLRTWWLEGVANVDSENRQHDLQLHQRCGLPIGVPHLRSTLPARP